MRHRVLVVLLFLITSHGGVVGRAMAVPPGVSARFDVNPGDAEVWIGGRQVGMARTPLRLDLTPFQGEGILRVQIVLDGYETRRLFVPLDYFLTHNVYPESGEIVMQPDGFLGRVRHQLRSMGYRVVPMLAGIAAALFLGGLSLHLFRSLRREGRDGLPAQLGTYRVLERIGAGSCAVVYRGDSLADGRPVALKVIKDELSQQAEYRARFEREILVYRRLVHPGIVRILDWGSFRDRLYVVTEYAEGGTLEALLARGTLPLDQARRLVAEIFNAVHHAHDQGVVHRDLKPQNVLIDAQGHACVADFGLAASAAFATLTATGRMLGTPAYIAPELIRPQPRSTDADPRADQYSLGVLAYDMLASGRPYRMDTVEQALWGHLEGVPEPASALRPELPSPVDGVLLRMLSKDPKARYATVAEALAALEKAFGPFGEEQVKR